MHIVILEKPVGNVIAHDEVCGNRDGEFFIDQDSKVYYRSQYDSRVWFANNDPISFEDSVAALDCYNKQIELAEDEQSQLRCVEHLKKELERIGAISDAPDVYWSTILEQAEQGLL